MSDSLQDRAAMLLRDFKGDGYSFGEYAIDKLGAQICDFGYNIVICAGHTARSTDLLDRVVREVFSAGAVVAAQFDAARPNAPIEDVQAMAEGLSRVEHVDCVIVAGGGSAIDATKAAVALHSLGGDLEHYYGVGLVTEALGRRDLALVPTIAVMTAASSAAHLTRYSNITNLSAGQKKLIIDDAIVPTRAAFDYAVTTGMSVSFTLDGGFDGVGHSLEVYLGATGSAAYDKIERIALTGIELIITHLDKAVREPESLDARTALGLGTDLGGYAIMTGGTSGPHLNSFSMVDILSHGRAVAILNPYYLVFFAPACERQLRRLAELYGRAGYLGRDVSGLHGRDLGLAVSEAMLRLAEKVGFPTKLGDVPGFDAEHVQRCLSSAKNPQLRSKLENMPVPLAPESVDDYMGAVLEAATVGDPTLVRNMA
ncbi:MAG: iron-containing alcohol dehydrogenase [Phycisphaerae bacterium]|nr:iron-containing alcohol dehydrogenase [Phycisphaerae bacterium]